MDAIQLSCRSSYDFCIVFRKCAYDVKTNIDYCSITLYQILNLKSQAMTVVPLERAFSFGLDEKVLFT